MFIHDHGMQENNFPNEKHLITIIYHFVPCSKQNVSYKVTVNRVCMMENIILDPKHIADGIRIAGWQNH